MRHRSAALVALAALAGLCALAAAQTPSVCNSAADNGLWCIHDGQHNTQFFWCSYPGLAAWTSCAPGTYCTVAGKHTLDNPCTFEPIVVDQCPDDPLKTAPGQCGCNRREIDPSTGYYPPFSLTLQQSHLNVTLLPGGASKQLECLPGGLWGHGTLVGENSGPLITMDESGLVMCEIPPAGPANASIAFTVGIAFGPGPDGSFGNFAYLSNYGSRTILKMAPDGRVTLFATLTTGPASLDFDYRNIFGGSLFVVEGAFNGPIAKYNAAGVRIGELNSAVKSTYIKFSPGGAWGDYLYSTHAGSADAPAGLVRIRPDGTWEPFGAPFTSQPEGFEFIPASFGNNPLGVSMIAVDVGSGEIWQYYPDGSRTLFGNLPGVADVAFCQNHLYINSNGLGCYQITQPVRQDFSCPAGAEFGFYCVEGHPNQAMWCAPPFYQDYVNCPAGTQCRGVSRQRQSIFPCNF